MNMNLLLINYELDFFFFFYIYLFNIITHRYNNTLITIDHKISKYDVKLILDVCPCSCLAGRAEERVRGRVEAAQRPARQVPQPGARVRRAARPLRRGAAQQGEPHLPPPGTENCWISGQSRVADTGWQ